MLRPEPTAPFGSVQYALRVLESVTHHRDGVDVTQLGDEVGLAPRDLLPLLRMLRREGYLEQVADDAYTVGRSLTRLSGSGWEREEALRERLEHTLRELRDVLGAAVYLSRYTEGELEMLGYADSPTAPVVDEWVDFRSAVHATAIGKCLLGQLDHDGRRDHLSRHKAARLTARTITDQRYLLDTLDRQPPTVPVLDLQEYATDTVCAAVPITAGSSVGCLALSLPVEETHRLRRSAEALNQRAAPVMLSLAI